MCALFNNSVWHEGGEQCKGLGRLCSSIFLVFHFVRLLVRVIYEYVKSFIPQILVMFKCVTSDDDCEYDCTSHYELYFLIYQYIEPF